MAFIEGFHIQVFHNMTHESQNRRPLILESAADIERIQMRRSEAQQGTEDDR
jgi:hypothetical protein